MWRIFKVHHAHNILGWEDLTSNFYSRPDDIHACANYTGDRLALPLCTASCNSEFSAISVTAYDFQLSFQPIRLLQSDMRREAFACWILPKMTRMDSLRHTLHSAPT